MAQKFVFTLGVRGGKVAPGPVFFAHFPRKVPHSFLVELKLDHRVDPPLLVVLLVFVELSRECPVEPGLPFRFCEVVWWDCSVFRGRSWCFGESDWSVVGVFCPLHCGAVEREVNLV